MPPVLVLVERQTPTQISSLLSINHNTKLTSGVSSLPPSAMVENLTKLRLWTNVPDVPTYVLLDSSLCYSRLRLTSHPF